MAGTIKKHIRLTRISNSLKAAQGLSPFLTIPILTIILLFKFCRFIEKSIKFSGIVYKRKFSKNLLGKHL
jgi:hypothetical protein